MKGKNIICPFCGYINVGVDLEESNGSVECLKCSQVFVVSKKELNVYKNVVFTHLLPKENKVNA